MARLPKAEVEAILAEALVYHFKASGEKYTCSAVVIAEISPSAERYAAIVQSEGYKITARRITNLALKQIHDEQMLTNQGEVR